MRDIVYEKNIYFSCIINKVREIKQIYKPESAQNLSFNRISYYIGIVTFYGHKDVINTHNIFYKHLHTSKKRVIVIKHTCFFLRLSSYDHVNANKLL